VLQRLFLKTIRGHIYQEERLIKQIHQTKLARAERGHVVEEEKKEDEE
jgi:hypothetical protein